MEMPARKLSNQVEDKERIYTIKDIQEIFQISHNTAYKLVNSRNFPKIKINRRLYIPERQLRKWIDLHIFKELEI